MFQRHENYYHCNGNFISLTLVKVYAKESVPQFIAIYQLKTCTCTCILKEKQEVNYFYQTFGNTIIVWNVPLGHDTFYPVTYVEWLWSGHTFNWLSVYWGNPLIEVTLYIYFYIIF